MLLHKERKCGFGHSYHLNLKEHPVGGSSGRAFFLYEQLWVQSPLETFAIIPNGSSNDEKLGSTYLLGSY